MLQKLKQYFDYNQRELNRIQKIVDQINKEEDSVRDLKDSDFKKETLRLKELINGDTTKLDEYLPYAFALVREAARRVLGMRHFDEQLIAGIVLHEGNIAEQKTGEGKTLAATAPIYLNALAGKGVHLVTVNDYLARRDAGWKGAIYHMLGMTVSSIISDTSYIYDPEYSDNTATDWRLVHLRPCSRKEAYDADITYGINSEFGFDYLRDNMAQDPSQLVQRGFSYAIIDEVDSVLIDEARTPHIISQPYTQDTSKYYNYATYVKGLTEDDYTIDEKAKSTHLNEQGVEKIEKMLGVENMYEKDYETLFHIEAALKARALFKKDKDYIVRDGEVVIVDEFTGRLLEGRRYSEGLHQAIEAKENVEIKRESRTLATISLQNYFRAYDKLAGMTGTAQTEAEEFKKIYDLETLIIPTHRAIQRNDHPDYIYKTEKGKFAAVVEKIAELHKEGRPVLVGTPSIDKNEELSKVLKKRKIPHEVLNAKNHLKEAQIISKAGMKGAVTVATNMAGRGVDIVLGGESPSRFKIDPELSKTDAEKEYKRQKAEWQKNHDEIVDLGGLYVMSTERHESRRIDNQLRGRAGRQGDPGDTRFFVSLEDDLMRIFGGDQVSKVMTMLNIPENQPIEHRMISRALEQAQQKVEGFNFDTRKHLVDYDDVLNKQREILYGLRKIYLRVDPQKPEKLEEEIFRGFNEYAQSLVTLHMYAGEMPDYDAMAEELDVIFPGTAQDMLEEIKSYTSDEDVLEHIREEFKELYNNRKKKAGDILWSGAVRAIALNTIDTRWTEHLTAIDDLRSGIGLRGYAQLDPLTEYKNEAFSMFEQLLSNIDFEILRRISQVQIDEQTAEQVMADSPTKDATFTSASTIDVFKRGAQTGSEGQVASDKSGTPHTHAENAQKPPSRSVPKAEKPGRNDPCWCGSGKKYKKCHYPE